MWCLAARLSSRCWRFEKAGFWVFVPNKFTVGRTRWPRDDVIFIESLYRWCPQLSRRLGLNTKTKVLLGLLAGRKPVLKWCWNAGSETTHPVKFLPELTCKSKVSLNCLEQVKIIKGLQIWERRKKESEDSTEDGNMVLDQTLSLWKGLLELGSSWRLL